MYAILSGEKLAAFVKTSRKTLSEMNRRCVSGAGVEVLDKTPNEEFVLANLGFMLEKIKRQTKGIKSHIVSTFSFILTLFKLSYICEHYWLAADCLVSNRIIGTTTNMRASTTDWLAGCWLSGE